MYELIQTVIVYINLITTGCEAHISRKASQGGGDLWKQSVYCWYSKLLNIFLSPFVCVGLCISFTFSTFLPLVGNFTFSR